MHLVTFDTFFLVRPKRILGLCYVVVKVSTCTFIRFDGLIFCQRNNVFKLCLQFNRDDIISVTKVTITIKHIQSKLSKRRSSLWMLEMPCSVKLIYSYFAKWKTWCWKVLFTKSVIFHLDMDSRTFFVVILFDHCTPASTCCLWQDENL